MRDLLVEMLEANKGLPHPGRGKENARLVRKVCDQLGLNEDDYLERYVVRDKKGWGLDERT